MAQSGSSGSGSSTGHGTNVIVLHSLTLVYELVTGELLGRSDKILEGNLQWYSNPIQGVVILQLVFILSQHFCQVTLTIRWCPFTPE